MGTIYRRALRPILFTFDSEVIHDSLTDCGSMLGRLVKTLGVSKQGTDAERRNAELTQTLHGITFNNPIGLAAGFDYEGKLPYVLPYLGFGFGTVGTITNRPYEGNKPPRLGRLIPRKALVVNKGFKNFGIERLVQRFRDQKFALPVGLSIGKTNCRAQDAELLKTEPGSSASELETQDSAVTDVVSAFTKAEAAGLPFTHYELNISCPNLFGTVEFYSLENLRDLLSAVTRLKLSKPLFIKMPITESDERVLAMLAVIATFPVQGVIFGNLRKESGVRGGVSGKPTESRSNELIALAYRHFGPRLTVIGCGGVFNAMDAYKKIKLGASLVQLVTGLVYEGPFLPRKITRDLRKLLARDGYANIHQAIGTSNPYLLE